MSDFADRLEKLTAAGKPVKAPVAQLVPQALRYSGVPASLDALRERASRGDKGSIATGWPTIDDGFDLPVLPGEILMITARTGVGKTWAVNGIIEHSLRRDPNMRCLLASLEMSDIQIAHRLAAHAIGRTPRRIWEDLQSGMVKPHDVLSRAPELHRLLIMDSNIPVQRLSEAITHASERLDGHVGLIAVDYFGLLGWQGRGNASRYERTSENITLLKDLVKQHEVVLLLAVQLNREGGAAGEKEPHLASLRDSGVAEDTGDRILALWRPAGESDEGDEKPAEVEVRVKFLKNRFGPLGKAVTLRYTEAMLLEEIPPVGAYSIPESLEGEWHDDLPY